MSAPPTTGFTFTSVPQRVIFGSGTLRQLPGEIERLGGTRAFVITTADQEAQGRQAGDMLGTLTAALFPGAVQHTPTDVTARALEAFTSSDADCLVSIGGGSTTGLGKALALRSGRPHIVVPTTYAGSEMTPILGETEDGVKRTQRSPAILPQAVIYDVDLTLTLPVGLSAASGMNAIAHAVEALYAVDGNPIIALLAEEGVAALARSLPRLVAPGGSGDGRARSDALYGAWLCGACLGAVSMALHHKLCHVLGGTFNLPHAETHAVVLPHVTAYNAPATPEAMRRLGRALGADDPAAALFDLLEALGLPTSLAAIGMPEDGVERAVELATSNPYGNPRDITPSGIRGLIGRALSGARPVQD